jgi:uncharacterized alpha-E superfamily protein
LTGVEAHAVHETAAALERAEACSRVLAARARASRQGAAQAAVFAALAAAAPDGLVPAPGSGAAQLARHLDQAAQSAAAAGDALPDEVVDALAWAAGEALRHAATSRALDPQDISRVVRRKVATVRGLAEHTMSRGPAWELMRLGTYLPRAAWVTALLQASAHLAGERDWRGGAPWSAAETVTGADRVAGREPGHDGTPEFLLLDPRYPFSVAFSLGEVEGAVFVLARGGDDADAGLGLARMASARLRRPDVRQAVAGGLAELLDEVLDRIGAVAAAAVPAAGEAPDGSMDRELAAAG